MKKVLFFLSFLSIFFAPGYSFAQDVQLEIDTLSIEKNIPQIKLSINAQYNHEPWKVQADNILISEKIGKNGTWKTLTVLDVNPTRKYRERRPRPEEVNFIFLLDVSNAMSANDLVKAKGIIKELVSRYSIKGDETFSIQPFSDHLDLKLPISVNINKLDQEFQKISISQRDPWFYHNIYKFINRYLFLRDEKTIVIVLSSGLDRSDSTQLRIQKPILPKDILTQFPVVLKDQARFYIYPIAIGDSTNTSFLSQLPKTTPNDDDEFVEAKIPGKLNDAVQGIEKMLIATHQVTVQPLDFVFMGEERYYKIEDVGGNYKSKPKLFIAGIAEPIDTRYRPFGNVIMNLLLNIFIGLAILSLLYGLFVFFLPSIRKNLFKRKHVKPYRIEGNRRHFDQLTNLPIEEGTPTVYLCSQVTPFQTWVDFGWQCPNHPNCLSNPQFRCQGAGAPVNYNDFFNIQDAFLRRLNWLFFGAVGGFVGVLFFMIIKELALKGNSLASVFFQDKSISARLEMSLNNVLLGGCFGVGLAFMLSWVEERGQSRKTSWSRILLRTFLGVIMSALIFAFGFSLQQNQLLGSRFMGSLATWVLFGLGLGLVLSVQSSIPILRSILGGAVAGLVTFFVRLLIVSISKDSFDLANVLALLMMGAILGYALATFISVFEDIKIEYLAPSLYHRVESIGRWLESGTVVNLGTDPNNKIRIKWDDKVALPLHAQLKYEKQQTYLTAFAETLVNGIIVPLNQKFALSNGDIIQPGRSSISKFKYLEKRRGNNQSNPVAGSAVTTSTKGKLGANIVRK